MTTINASEFSSPFDSSIGFEPFQLSRRHLLLAGALALGKVVVDADKGLTNHIWQDTDTELKILNGNLTYLYSDTGWLVVPGFGSRNGKGMAKHLSAALGVDRPLAYFDYSTAGIDVVDLTRKITDYSLPFNNISLYGHSMGGPSALHAMRRTKVPINRILLNCSPFDMEDARHGELAHPVAQLAKSMDFEGDFASTYLGTVKNDVSRRGLASIFKDVYSAVQETADGPSPKLLVNQLKLLDDIHLFRNWRQFRPIINRNTQVLYASPLNPDHDRTVNTLQAYEKWSEFFGNFKVEVQYLGVPDVEHANTPRTLIAAKPWLQEAF